MQCNGSQKQVKIAGGVMTTFIKHNSTIPAESPKSSPLILFGLTVLLDLPHFYGFTTYLSAWAYSRRQPKATNFLNQLMQLPRYVWLPL